MLFHSADIPVKYSNHAGAYLCNHVMYTALHYLRRIKTKHFLWIYSCAGSVEQFRLEKQIEAIELCIEVLMRQKSIIVR